MPKTAVQQIMIGSLCKNETSAEATLAQIKAAGFDALELNSFMIHPASWLVRALTKAAGMPTGNTGKLDWNALIKNSDLKVTSLHTDLGSLKRDIAAVADECHRFATNYAVITGMYRFDYSDRASVEGLARDLTECGKALAEQGISLLYHNHNCDFLRTADGAHAYDILLEQTDPACVNFEFDSYWAADAGVDTVALMKRLGERLKLYHINDRGTRPNGPTMTPIIKSDALELGCGNMPLDALVDQACAVGTDTIVLEQHKNWVDGSVVKSIQMGGSWLHTKLKASAESV